MYTERHSGKNKMNKKVSRLVEHGVKVTFVNTDFTHNLVTNAASNDESVNDLVSLVSLPDGVEAAEDRNDLGKLTDAIFQVMPAKLEELVDKINGSDGDKVTCIVADHCMGWAFGVAEKMKIRRAAFWPAAAVVLASLFSIPNLLEDGIINSNGELHSKEKITQESKR
ncbi:putative cyanohydrin beta-glucosyltransferase [Helianthus annuus]|uniref:Cyanohydrin beta-glucosyltransferase n=2 Tax=Helianthus annuus TaxID=4232 RepID=A0A9K3I893_HELAN|nr:putative cyanohydrin beta-glucosyltransferase [Helianthus annuus]KAJ0526968.1 putative cyanohydrin beta-glucosyltransferase [Helianthus annuus]KAJ0535543.1 putative cyanohydrin beta-glucosyltransferase [Helianthus annuus]KAJ0543362.1 putative cyanohydrin beta-glucosyltransferase [Helianthus annuus]KAJ0708420.1 putative cyanohydrin beta-glucosyltransferase [Helianthus annuus]